MTIRITRESLRAAGACYTDDRIVELIPPEGLAPSQVAALPIPAHDRHWALCYATPDTPEVRRALREHACAEARHALALVESPDPRSVACVEVAERYARGEATSEELRAARAAASAASDAAWAAAWAAARERAVVDLAARLGAL